MEFEKLLKYTERDNVFTFGTKGLEASIDMMALCSWKMKLKTMLWFTVIFILNSLRQNHLHYTFYCYICPIQTFLKIFIKYFSAGFSCHNFFFSLYPVIQKYIPAIRCDSLTWRNSLIHKKIILFNSLILIIDYFTVIIKSLS